MSSTTSTTSSTADGPPVLDFEQAARTKLAPEVYDFFAGGADDEETLADSIHAWRRLKFVPRVLRDVSNVDLSTTLLGQNVSAPIGIAPVGYQGMLADDADISMAEAAAATNTVFTISTRASSIPQAITDAVPEGLRWFQTYILRDRQFTADLALGAADAGARAIVLTADMPVLARRMRDVHNRFVLPPSISSSARSGQPTLQTGALAQDPALSFDDIAWLRDLTGLPVVVKGVVSPADAEMCVEAGASAIWVSAHGGRQLDGCIAPADALSGVVAAVAGRAEVYVDGGIRRGADVLRALALGARAAFIGRPAAWGLTVSGACGVREVVEGFKNELALAMALTGTTSTEAVSADIVRGNSA